MAERSFNEIRAILSDSLPKPSKADGYTYINDCGADWLVYYDSGKLKKCSYSIDDSGKATLGEVSEVVERTVYEPVSMSVFSDSAEGKEWQGKIFEAGDFPDKGVSFTEDDLDAMVESFSEVEINLEHLGVIHGETTVLDGKLGKLKKIWRKGSELFGSAVVPEWLDRALDKAERKVSVEIDNIAKQITGIALVCNPRVSDAALMAAFRSSTVSADVADKSKAVQPANGGKPRMSILDTVKAWFESGPDQKGKEVKLQAVIDGSAEHTSVEPPKPDQAFSDQFSAMKAENDQLKGQMQAQEAARLEDKAHAFAQSLLVDERIVPAQLEHVASMYRNAVRADSAGKSCFSDTGTVIEGESVKAVVEAFSNAPKHGLLSEKMKIVMSEEQVTKAKADEAKYLGATETGKQAIQAEGGK